MDEPIPDADERVLATAIRLFAELGYDATSLEMITTVAGPDASRSSLVRGGKPQIYRAVLDHFHDLEKAHFEAAAADAPPDPEGVHRLVDAAVDFGADHPEISAIWMHRGLKDAQDLGFPEDFSPRLETVMAAIPWQGLREDVDLRFLAWTVIWMVMGFTRAGLSAPDRRPGTDDPHLRYFRTQLHELVDHRIRP